MSRAWPWLLLIWLAAACAPLGVPGDPARGATEALRLTWTSGTLHAVRVRTPTGRKVKPGSAGAAGGAAGPLGKDPRPG